MNANNNPEKLIEEVHKYEHIEKMRFIAMLQNLGLCFFVAILSFVFWNFWPFLLLFFWDDENYKG